MFTGIITDLGWVDHSEPGNPYIAIGCSYDHRDIVIGESIACNGVCLTVVDKGALPKQQPNPMSFVGFHVSEETRSRTAAHQWQEQATVNLERAMQAHDRFGGHMVTGHIDGVAQVISRTPTQDGSIRFVIEAPQELARFIAAKGSVALDGVSLTVNSVEGSRFDVNIIPHTAQATNLGEKQAGGQLNLEVDLVARYLDRLIQR